MIHQLFAPGAKWWMRLFDQCGCRWWSFQLHGGLWGSVLVRSGTISASLIDRIRIQAAAALAVFQMVLLGLEGLAGEHSMREKTEC